MPKIKRLISPPPEEWDNLRQPLWGGERQFIEYLDAKLHEDWEIYIQPHLNGLCPDVVILHPRVGIAVFEVKDWDFNAIHYYTERKNNGRLHLMGNKNGEIISYVRKNPVDQLLLYRRELMDIYCPQLNSRDGPLAITCGLILPLISRQQAKSVIEPVFEDRNRKLFDPQKSPYGKYLLFIKDSFDLPVSQVLPDSITRLGSKYMNPIIAQYLRSWLTEADAVKEQRDGLPFDERQKTFIFSRTESGYRRLKGPAGSGKSVVVAGRASQLLQTAKKLLVVSFNITLINYLQDLTVRVYPKARKEATWLNFHSLCKRICYDAGLQEEYAQLFIDAERKNLDFPDNDTFCALVQKAFDISEPDKFDAILVDEGQDFNPQWWAILRQLLVENGEMLLVADTTQDIYESAKLWTDEAMTNAGFRGSWAELEKTYRLPDNLIPLANNFAQTYLPSEKIIISKKDSNQGILDFEPTKEAQLRWVTTTNLNEYTLLDWFTLFKQDVIKSGLSHSDMTILVQKNEIGFNVCNILSKLKIKYTDIFSNDRRAAKQKKMYFFKGAGVPKVCTTHSFKGWEAKAILIFFDRLMSDSDYALLYTAMTRLKAGKNSLMYVICADSSLQTYGETWSKEYTLGESST